MLLAPLSALPHTLKQLLPSTVFLTVPPGEGGAVVNLCDHVLLSKLHPQSAVVCGLCDRVKGGWGWELQPQELRM